MSATESLRENSTQNTFVALMFAIAYSIGPVYPFITKLTVGSGWSTYSYIMAMVFRD